MSVESLMSGLIGALAGGLITGGFTIYAINRTETFAKSSDVPPILSSTAIWSPIPNDKEIGREEAFYRRADHRLPA